MGYKGRYAAKKVRPVWVKVTLIIGAVLLALALVGAVLFAVGADMVKDLLGMVNYAGDDDSTMSSEDQQRLEDEISINNDLAVDATDPTDDLVVDPDEYIQKTPNIINILLVGQDMRSGQTWKLSDSMILCTINQEEKSLTMTSFLRDMYVKLPNYNGDGKDHKCGYNRINNCYALGYSWNGTVGAMEMLDQCLLENFGVQVDYNVEVDFSAFEKIVDIMGGVDIELTKAEANHLNKKENWDLTEGVNHLNGKEALAYARIRKIDNDFYRTNRQRIVMNVLIEKCRELSILELNELLQTLLPMITTDMDSSVIAEYALELLPLLADLTVTSQAIPAEGTYYYANKGTEEEPMEVIVPNLEQNRQILKDTIGG